MNNFCHNDLVFSFSQIYQIIIIWNNQRNIFHHHSQNQAKEKRPFKTSLPLRQSNAHPSQQNAPVRLICARTGPILSQIYRPIKLMFKKSVQTPFKIKMQFNSIKLFARFVFLGWLFNFISNLLLFNQTDYVLLYTVFTHFVLPPLIAKIVKNGKPYCLRRNINRYKSKIFGNKKRATFYSRPSKHSDYRKVSLKIIRILLFNREFIYTLAEILFSRTQHHTWEARLVGRIGIMLCFETQSTAMRINHT